METEKSLKTKMEEFEARFNLFVKASSGLLKKLDATLDENEALKLKVKELEGNGTLTLRVKALEEKLAKHG